ncbi:hypothetical protein [Mycolicibacterium fortuitum]|uniref:hypothetical protein n=1 Tax=Mycolicibacterium fortuitum TaxID=1766 RepID=UPI0007E9865E|nr:hypothetical protein [Mycolicibacterium fortuitum]OBF77062.1 hypothetical protein A5751_23055 [Mycolicibacterium fortuitum]
MTDQDWPPPGWTQQDCDRLVAITYRQLCEQIAAGEVADPATALADMDRLWSGRSVQWMLPTLQMPGEDDWLTDEEVARWVGCRAVTVRNWASRARRGGDGVIPINGRYRWGDVQEYRQRQNQRRQGQSDG